MEEIIIHYCINCGTKIPEKAKFCPNCGEKVDQSVELDAVSSVEVSSVAPDIKEAREEVNTNFTLLDPGDEFHSYKILRMMNKDSEGIKYIAEKDGREYVLKVFYKSSFHNMHTLVNLQMRLSRLNNLKDTRIAKVVEVNQSHSPAYMAVEYVHGVSLAELRKYNPERITENMVRELGLKLIQIGKAVRNHGLTISSLTLNGVMVKEDGELIILTSGIHYEDVDEREDVYIVAKIMAQILAKNPVIQRLYDEDRLRSNKFMPIVGVSVNLNKVLSEALHRNIVQRYGSLEELEQAIGKLPPVEGAELVVQQDTMVLDTGQDSTARSMPRARIEYGFWALVIVVIIAIAMLFTTNIYTVLFGAKGDKLQYTGFSFGSDSADDDSLRAPAAKLPPREGRSPAQTTYGELKRFDDQPRIDPRRSIDTSVESPAPAPVIKPKRPGANFVYIEPGTYGFGRLSDNQAHNVSLSGFYISKYELTQAEWNRLMKPAKVSEVGNKLPVDNVSWFDIAIFCNGLSEEQGLTPAYKIRGVGASRVVTCDFDANGYRLPTEAEWEYAAKAGKLFNYSGSDDPEDVAWYRDNSAGKLRQPGLKDANAFGLYDCSGNVSEWVWDWYDANYIRALPTFVNPNGPATGTQKTIRGGNVMNSEGRNLNILWREKGDPNRGYPFVGFRLARSK
ncbi:MAG: SUMF1/EgtB/PvdO family nonheme iron enzyme [Candidatus Cloacimonetes bacterium]|nr:SUMF1/EgtB/PvdO family nonheme iron enzyme [Candidatus Cloacimonadota bacterium]MDD2505985.1 SUMF1/EgtB/PvdO family nonheme iron enzyme [Candidatus Cloacimonadota bacterium]MDD4146959.1 SUMF1/EgtB/PvdO family nonheme iron enzyme [Candidatus Cloacimonadota bacterium]MDD4559259.1 SUMF1/EgtB/PvdO family nonheme iron enzyme [Candidatus Cloacimonadota bacterium]